MKAPTAASLKEVTAENLEALGASRLADILVSVAEGRPELKRRLRMELAAEQGADHLAYEIDKRLASLETSRSKVSWRQRPTFVRDLDGVRGLIAVRLADLDRSAALDRLWRFMDIGRRVGPRVRDKDGELAAVFSRAAGDIASLISSLDEGQAADALVSAIVLNPWAWAGWLPSVLEVASNGLADAALRALSLRRGAVPGWIGLIRQLADAAGDVDAYRSTYSDQDMRDPQFAATVAQRLLAAGRIAEAGAALKAAAPATSGRSLLGKTRTPEPDFGWETAQIEFLERSGKGDAAQAVRWASFERTLSVERAREFTRRLTDFADVEAEERAFNLAANHVDFALGLRFLMEWPALPQAARMVQTRAGEARPGPEEAELWASKLRARQPAAAETLLRKAAATAFRRRDFATCDRLTEEADGIST